VCACACVLARAHPPAHTKVTPLDPADTITAAAALLRDAAVAVKWQEEEEQGDPDSAASGAAASGAAASGAAASGTAASGGAVSPAAASGAAASGAAASSAAASVFLVPDPLPLPDLLPMPMDDEDEERRPPPPAREPPLGLSELTLPLHGMIQLSEGSTAVVDEHWTFRAVACLLGIRLRKAQACIALESGGAVSPTDVIVPPDFVMPNDWMTECHRELKELYMPAIKAAWELRHGRSFVEKSKQEPKGCDTRSACPAFLIYYVSIARSGDIGKPGHRHCGFACWSCCCCCCSASCRCCCCCRRCCCCSSCCSAVVAAIAVWCSGFQ